MGKIWEDVGLIGRDSLLKNVIYTRSNSSSQQFILLGEMGTGKTAILEWAHEHTKAKSALVPANIPFASILDGIIEGWEIETDPKQKLKSEDKKVLVLQQAGNTLFVDDLHRAPPKLLQFLKVLSERNKLCGALTTGGKFKEELKQLIWSCENITIKRLPPPKARKLAKKVCRHFGSMVSSVEIANRTDGYPARIIASAKTGEIPRHGGTRLKSEEIDIAPIFISCLACLALFRYFGRAMGATDLVLIGGIGMLVLIFGRNLIRHGREK